MSNDGRCETRDTDYGIILLEDVDEIARFRGGQFRCVERECDSVDLLQVLEEISLEGLSHSKPRHGGRTT